MMYIYKVREFSDFGRFVTPDIPPYKYRPGYALEREFWVYRDDETGTEIEVHPEDIPATAWKVAGKPIWRVQSGEYRFVRKLKTAYTGRERACQHCQHVHRCQNSGTVCRNFRWSLETCTDMLHRISYIYRALTRGAENRERERKVLYQLLDDGIPAADITEALAASLKGQCMASDDIVAWAGSVDLEVIRSIRAMPKRVYKTDAPYDGDLSIPAREQYAREWIKILSKKEIRL